MTLTKISQTEYYTSDASTMTRERKVVEVSEETDLIIEYKGEQRYMLPFNMEELQVIKPVASYPSPCIGNHPSSF
jgi:hypothetical protein